MQYKSFSSSFLSLFHSLKLLCIGIICNFHPFICFFFLSILFSFHSIAMYMSFIIGSSNYQQNDTANNKCMDLFGCYSMQLQITREKTNYNKKKEKNFKPSMHRPNNNECHNRFKSVLKCTVHQSQQANNMFNSSTYLYALYSCMLTYTIVKEEITHWERIIIFRAHKSTDFSWNGKY